MSRAQQPDRPPDLGCHRRPFLTTDQHRGPGLAIPPRQDGIALFELITLPLMGDTASDPAHERGLTDFLRVS